MPIDKDPCRQGTGPVLALVRASVILLCLQLPAGSEGEVIRQTDENGHVTLTDREETDPADAAVPTAVIFKYVDEKGRLHFTDNEDTIPPEYLDAVTEMKGFPKAGGGLEEPLVEVFTGEREAAWSAYKGMGWIERNWLVFRVGLKDPWGLLKSGKYKFAFTTFVFFSVAVLAMLKVRQGSLRAMLISLLVVFYLQMLMVQKVNSTLARGREILAGTVQADAPRGDALRGDALRGDALRGDALRGDALNDDALYFRGINDEQTRLFKILLDEEGF